MLVEMTKFWESKGEYPDHFYIFDKIFALKKFGADLAERILRQPEIEEAFGNERKMLLTDLVEKLEEQKNAAHANMSKIKEWVLFEKLFFKFWFLEKILFSKTF